MTVPVLSPAALAVLRPPRPTTAARDRSVRLRVTLVWCLLFLNVLTFYAQLATAVPVPGPVGKLATQAALAAALVLVLTVNRAVVVRRSVFLALLLLLAAQAVVTSLQAEFVAGAMFRAGRFTLFVVVLWLLTPWWGRRDLLLVRAHLTMLGAVLATVLLGLLVAPSLAMTDGRLTGVIWPIPPTQVGHYAASLAGIAAVLWLSGRARTRLALLAVAVALPMLVLSHTRTALAALLAGTAIAGLSLVRVRSRVRRVFLTGAAVAVLAAVTVSSTLLTWLARGQTSDDLANFTGRRDVWDAILALPRSPFTELFGFGLSNKSFGGLPIDSNWLATYYDQGLVGVALTAAAVLCLVVVALYRQSSPERALALFLLTYCVVASFTETGLSDASPYVLELALAASLLAAPRTAAAP